MRATAALLWMVCASAQATLPGGVARAFADAGIPLSGVAVVVRESGQPQALFSHDPNRPMNPASVMKVVTTYAALELLGPEYRWKTEAYLAGKLDRKGMLAGNLVIKGYGDPKITIEQWQAFMARPARRRGSPRSPATSCSTAPTSSCREHDPAAFDQEPLRPYNVGPDALLVNFKAVRFAFAPGPARATRLPCAPTRRCPRSPCPGCRSSSTAIAATGAPSLAAQYVDLGSKAVATFPGRYPASMRRARLVRVAARPSALRARHVHDVLPRPGRDVLGHACRKAGSAPQCASRSR